MPFLTFAVLGLMLLGTLFGQPKPAPSQAAASMAAPQTSPAEPTPEPSTPMLYGVVQAIDRSALRVTIRTEIGRLVPVTVDSCDLIQELQVGDRVRLAMDTQGIVYALEFTGVPLTSAPDQSLSSSRRPTPCQETAAT